MDIIYGKGISREGSLIDVGVEQGIIRKSGAWYTYDGDQLGQGKENVRGFLRVIRTSPRRSRRRSWRSWAWAGRPTPPASQAAAGGLLIAADGRPASGTYGAGLGRSPAPASHPGA